MTAIIKKSDAYATALKKIGIRIRFRDPDIEGEFRQHWRFQANSQFTVALPLAACLLVLFGIFDYISTSEPARSALLYMRIFLLVPFLGLTLAMLNINKLRHHATPISIGLALSAGIVISAMIVAARHFGIEKPYLGIIFAIFYCYFFCRLLTTEATIVSVAISLFYFGGLAAISVPLSEIGNQGIWFLTAIIIGFAACRSNERYARKSFLQAQIINNIAESDGLTGLSNRHYFDASYKSAVENANRQGNSVAVMMLDIDHFKKINDSYGHQVGDEILKQAGFALRAATHTAPTMIARYGGDEFVLVWIGQAESDVVEIAETLRRGIHSACRKSDVRITTSAGLSWSYPPVDSKRLIARADEALYKAKDLGRNQLCRHSKSASLVQLAASSKKPAV